MTTTFRPRPNLRFFALGEGHEVLFDEADGTRRILPAAESQRMRSWLTYQPLEAVGALRIPIEMARGWLAAGYLCTPHSFLDLDRVDGGLGLEGPALDAIVILTCSRPQQLARCLESCLLNLRRHERELEIVVVDDSRDLRSVEENGREVTRLGKAFGASIRHIDRARRRAFARRISEASGVPLEIAEFALLGDDRSTMTAGAARNSALLELAGRRFISADDDAIWELAEPPSPTHGLRFSSRGDPLEIWFFESWQALRAEVAFAPADVVGEHARLLGHTARTLAAGARSIDVSLMTPAFERHLQNEQGVVRLTMAGIAGDSGVGSPSDFAFLDPASERRVTESEESHARALKSRWVLRVATCRTIARPGLFMPVCAGIDATALLPPFVPIQRNSDGIFSKVTARCCSEALTGYLSSAMRHEPMEERTPGERQKRLRYSDLMYFLLDTLEPPRSRGASNRIVELGAQLEQLATLGLGSFERELSLRLLTRERIQAQKLEARRPRADEPSAISARIDDYLAFRRASVADPDWIVPRDFPADLSHDSKRLLARELTGQIGRLYSAWPEIWRVAPTCSSG